LRSAEVFKRGSEPQRAGWREVGQEEPERLAMRLLVMEMAWGWCFSRTYPRTSSKGHLCPLRFGPSSTRNPIRPPSVPAYHPFQSFIGRLRLSIAGKQSDGSGSRWRYRLEPLERIFVRATRQKEVGGGILLGVQKVLSSFGGASSERYPLRDSRVPERVARSAHFALISLTLTAYAPTRRTRVADS
jgi:hypothetical protein